jgi:hypothetical protein
MNWHYSQWSSRLKAVWPCYGCRSLISLNSRLSATYLWQDLWHTYFIRQHKRSRCGAGAYIEADLQPSYGDRFADAKYDNSRVLSGPSLETKLST